MSLIPASMSTAIADRAKILGTLETLVIGAAGGLLFLWLSLPGGLISGAMATVGIAALAGRPVTMPPILTQSVLVLLGITLGSLVSRQLIQHMSAYPLTIGLLALATFCSTFGSSLYLQRVHGWDQTSALLAGSPGALSQITMLAAEKGADVAAIAVVQTMRVIILTAALPLLLALTGIAPSAPAAVASLIASPLELAVLAAAAVATALLLRLAKFPASWMFGAMIGSSVLHGTGLIEGGLPPWVRGVALVGIGALIGAVRAHDGQDAARPCQCGAGIVYHCHHHFRDLCRGDPAHHPCAVRRYRRRLRTGRDGRHAGAGADAAHRPDLRRRTSSVALRVRLDHDAGHRASVRPSAGGCGRLRLPSLRAAFVGWVERSDTHQRRRTCRR